jgi:DNA-binding response OmpR family regulator
MRVLLVEDEKRLAENIARTMREGAGYAVDIANDGERGMFLAESGEYDLLVLDLMIPKLDGQQILTRYRKRGRTAPVLILTARHEKDSIVRLLNAGADDYMAKPFDLGEFLARVKALVRRGKDRRSPIIAVADLQVDTVGRTVRRGHREIALVPMEFRVLEYLAHRSGAVVSKAELLEHLYDYNWEKFSNVIEVYVSGLRRKIDAHRSVKLIQTVRGHGYVLRAEQGSV